MGDYYGRQFEIGIGGSADKPSLFIEATTGRQFRVQFGVATDAGNANSYCELSIWGLSRETENKIFKRGLPIYLKAGYEFNLDYIFKGEVVNFFRTRQGPNRISKIIARGGAVKLENATITKSFGAGAKLAEIISACAAAIGYTVVFAKTSDFQKAFVRGYTLNGDPKHILNALSRQFDFQWVVENDRIVVLYQGSVRGAVTHKISALTGMIGSPEILTSRGGKFGVSVSVKLNPKIKWGEALQINSEFPRANISNVYFNDIAPTLGEGTYKALTIEHLGDSWGDEWTTRLTGSRWSLSA